MESIIYHYPPELLNLLVNAIPLLCKSKADVFYFLWGSGVNKEITRNLEQRWRQDKNSVNKYQIVRETLGKLNEAGEARLRERREILKRVVEFENFSICWPDDQLKAKGLIAEIREVINVKDSFTRINLEREQEQRLRKEEYQKRLQQERERKQSLESIKNEFFSLYGESDPHKRGKALEGILNRLFAHFKISTREAFTLKGVNKEGIVEQIDGVIKLDGEFYLVEMKWWNEPIDVGTISQHLVRIFTRGFARGIFISNSDYTAPALTTCREALQRTVIVLCKLEEIVFLLEHDKDLKDLLKNKIQAAIVDKNPFYQE